MIVNLTENSSKTTKKFKPSCQFPIRTESKKCSERYDTLAINRLIETNNSETSDLKDAHRSNIYSESRARILTQKKLDEQIKTYITALTKHQTTGGNDIGNAREFLSTKLFPEGECQG